MVRLVLASTAIKYEKHAADGLAFRLGEHFTDPSTIPIAARLSKPAILIFFQTGMCSQPPQHLSEPTACTIPSIAPCLMLAPFLPDSRDEWYDNQWNIKIGYLSLKLNCFPQFSLRLKYRRTIQHPNIWFLSSVQKYRTDNWNDRKGGKKTETINPNVFNNRSEGRLGETPAPQRAISTAVPNTLCNAHSTSAVHFDLWAPQLWLTCAQVLSPWDCSVGYPFALWPLLKGCSQIKHIKTVVKERWFFPRSVYLNSAGFYKATIYSWQSSLHQH